MKKELPTDLHTERDLNGVSDHGKMRLSGSILKGAVTQEV